MSAFLRIRNVQQVLLGPRELHVAVVFEELDELQDVEVEVWMRPDGGIERFAIQPRGTIALHQWERARQEELARLQYELETIDPKSDRERFDQLTVALDEGQRRLFEREGAPRVMDVRVGASKLRVIPWRTIEQLASRALAASRDAQAEMLRRQGWNSSNSRARWRDLQSFDDGGAPKGRPPTSDVELARLARDYVQQCRTGRGAVEALAGRWNLSTSAIHKRLTEARGRGLLTRAPRGRPGGELTERAVELLGSAE